MKLILYAFKFINKSIFPQYKKTLKYITHFIWLSYGEIHKTNQQLRNYYGYEQGDIF